MTYLAEIDIMLHPEVPDPQGEAIALGLKNLSVRNTGKVRVGKHIQLRVEAATEEEAREKVQSICQELLANRLTETYNFIIHPEEERHQSILEPPTVDEEE